MAVSARPEPTAETPLGTGSVAQKRPEGAPLPRPLTWDDIARRLRGRLGPGATEVRPEGDAPAEHVGRPADSGLLARPAELQGDRRGFVLRRRLLLADIAGLCAAMSIVELFGGLHHSRHSVGFDLACFLVAVPAWLLLIRAYGLYHIDSRRADHGVAEEIVPILQMTALSSWSLLLLFSVTGVAQVAVARLVLFWISAFALLLTFRAATRAWARRRSWYRQKTLVVGTPAESAAVVAKFKRHPEYGVDVVACLEPAEAAEDVLHIAGELGVDRVMLASSVGALCDRTTLLSELNDRNVHVDLIPGWAETVGSRLEVSEMEGTPILTLPRTRIPRSSLLMKRALDVGVSGTLLLLLAPVLVLCAIAIKLDTPGPVLFRQRRVGRAGRRFEILKFRSMHRDADSMKHELAALTLHPGASEAGIFKVAKDPRVTRVGRVLRRFSLDELPQLLNILRGDMSLVGPRPLPEEEHERITGRYRRRIDLMPGLTGLWQVHGRSNIPFEDMVGLDYLYVTNWSLWRDVKLLVRTFVVVLRASGAY